MIEDDILLNPKANTIPKTITSKYPPPSAINTLIINYFTHNYVSHINICQI